MIMELTEAARTFAALAQDTRIEVIRVLSARGDDGMSAGELAANLGQPPSTLSFHLSALEHAGLVQSTRHGRHVIYAVRRAGLRALFAFLAEACCHGRPALRRDLERLLPETEAPARMQPAFNVLFLCTHNSARSIMAEAILEVVGKGRFNAYSAGSEPGRRPMPDVIDRLAALGHDVSRLRSKSWHEFTGAHAPRMDVVITLCDTLIGEACPEFAGRAVAAAWPFPDPRKFKGSEAERTTNLNALYGMVRRRLELFVALPLASIDLASLRTRLDEMGDCTRYA